VDLKILVVNKLTTRIYSVTIGLMGSNDRARNILVGVVVLIIIVLVAVFLIRRRGAENLISVNSPLPTPVSTFQENLQNDFGITLPATATKADLHDVNGGSRAGILTKDNEAGQYVYTVIADLEDPAPGYFYQAWLVKDSDYVSLGKLSIAKGGWMVTMRTTRDLSDHRSVWVTSEKVFDNTPETHVLEGSF